MAALLPALVLFGGNYVVEYTFNYRLPHNLSQKDGLQGKSPLKRGMSDDALTGVEAPKTACVAHSNT